MFKFWGPFSYFAAIIFVTCLCALRRASLFIESVIFVYIFLLLQNICFLIKDILFVVLSDS